MAAHRSGREAQKTRKLLNAFYEVLYTRQEGEQGDLKLAAYLCDRGIVPEPGTFAEHGGRLGAAIALLQEKALVVSLERLERAAAQNNNELCADINIWYNKGMLPCWAIVYFDEGEVRRNSRQSSSGDATLKTDTASTSTRKGRLAGALFVIQQKNLTLTGFMIAC